MKQGEPSPVSWYHKLNAAQQERLDELVHDTASRVATDALNDGKGVDFLLSHGFTLDEIKVLVWHL